MRRPAPLRAFGLPLVIGLLAGLVACQRAHGPTLVERFGDWPFLTPIDAPATVALLGGGELPTDAATCGGCHGAFYAEWSKSTHASAMHDLQLMAELQKATSPRWLCLNCHIPTAVQRDRLITPSTRLVSAGDIGQIDAPPNPAHEPARMAEGITCATCHVRRDPDGQGTVIVPHEGVVAPHRTRIDPAALTNICVRCHSPGPAVISPSLFCWFETADELAQGPAAGSTCTSCHMPAAERAVAAGSPVRATRVHGWAGGGVPKSPEGYESLLARGYTPGVEVSVSADPLLVTLENTAGHALPTADPERYLRVEARYEDAAGATLDRALLRVGQRWDWGDAAVGRPPRRVKDERLGPGETREWRPDLARPDGAVALVVELSHVRLQPAYASGMRSVKLDAELQALWPDAAARLPDFERHYPLGTRIYRQRLPLGPDAGPPVVVPLAELLEESRRLTERPPAELEGLFAVP